MLSLLGIVEVSQARVVELQVGAAQRAETAHLLAVGRRQIGPELIHPGVDRFIDRGAASAVVDHARGGDGELRRLLRRDAGLQKRERLSEDRLRDPDLAVDTQRRRGELQRPSF